MIWLGNNILHPGTLPAGRLQCLDVRSRPRARRCSLGRQLFRVSGLLFYILSLCSNHRNALLGKVSRSRHPTPLSSYLAVPTMNQARASLIIYCAQPQRDIHAYTPETKHANTPLSLERSATAASRETSSCSYAMPVSDTLTYPVTGDAMDGTRRHTHTHIERERG